MAPFEEGATPGPPPPVEPALLRSEAEARFLSLVRAARLEPPAVNAVVRGDEMGFLWRGAGLVVEIDGFAYHGSRAAF